jgi:tetratricopeptide (TPR) repeat protein
MVGRGALPDRGRADGGVRRAHPGRTVRRRPAARRACVLPLPAGTRPRGVDRDGASRPCLGSLVREGALGVHCAAFTLFSAGRYDEAIAAYDAALAAARKRGDAVRSPAILAFRGRALTLAGNLEAALADLNEGLLAKSEGSVVPYAISFWASALLDRGRYDEAGAVLASRNLPEELPVTVHLFFFQLARGRLAVMTGSAERGVADLLDLGRRTQLVPFDNPADFPWRRYAVEGLVLLGRTDEAVPLAREELEIARRWGAAPTVAACLRTLGNVLGGEAGELLLREAVEIAAPTNPPPPPCGPRSPRSREGPGR